MLKLNDKVRFTQDRFTDFHGGQGVKDPKTVYTITQISGTTYWTTMFDGHKQCHDITHLIKVVKPTIIIARNK